MSRISRRRLVLSVRSVGRALALSLALSFALLLALGSSARATMTSTFVDAPFVIAGSPGGNFQYDAANVSVFVNPAITSWIAWNNAASLALANPLCAGGFCLGPGGFGTDDFIALRVVNPGGSALTVNLDQNNAFGNSFGPQNVIFGTAAAAPDALRRSPFFGSPPNVTTIFNEAGTHNAVFTTPGIYQFQFSFRDAFPGGAGHSDIFLLKDEGQGLFGPVAPPVDIGGGLSVSLDSGQVAGDLVGGDPCAATTNTGFEMGLDAQSLGRLPRDTKTCTARRSFFFQGPNPMPANVFGVLDGMLIADNQGDASVNVDMALFDSNHVLLGEDHFNLFIDSNLRQLVTADVFEDDELRIQALLTPGQLYEVSTTLRVSAFGGALGAGRSLFSNTLEYVIAGEDNNPLADPTRSTRITSRDLQVPAPASLVLFGLGLATVILWRRGRAAS